MYAMIRHYRFDPKHAAEINRLVSEQFQPLIKQMHGFVHWAWIDTGNGEGASFSVFQDKGGAEASLALAGDFTAKHMTHLMTGKPAVIAGNVMAYA